MEATNGIFSVHPAVAQLGARRWLTLTSVVLITAMGLALAAFFLQSSPTTISGVVVSANTSTPLSDVIVVVQSGMYDGPGSPSPIYVKTDKDGRFVAKLYDDNISIRAWKQGYAENGSTASDRTSNGEIKIKLRPMTDTNWVPEHDEFYDFEFWKGFSFSSAKTKSADNPDVDVVFLQNEDDPLEAFIKVNEHGGIIFQPIVENVDFYNTPVAPMTGYQRRVPVELQHAGIYFLRTRDGKHYAKFRLMLSAVTTPAGSKHLNWASVRMIWSYQPDGSNNLEVQPKAPIPYPFSEFGREH